MNFPKRDVITGLLIVIIIVAGVFFYKKLKTPKPLATNTPVSISFKKELESQFKYQIPEGVESIELKDVRGGTGRAIATKGEILADIEDPTTGAFYQGWLEKDGSLVSLGKMQMAKGGWLLEYDSSKFPEYKKVVVSLEKTYDSKMEEKVLEGSF